MVRQMNRNRRRVPTPEPNYNPFAMAVDQDRPPSPRQIVYNDDTHSLRITIDPEPITRRIIHRLIP